MGGFLADSNVLLDVATEDPRWFEWSAAALANAVRSGPVYINALIYTEVSTNYDRIEELDDVLPDTIFRRAPLPFEAGFLAAKAFRSYRARRGNKSSPLPDFCIGAHAAVAGLSLLTRDARRYRTYFPTVELITP